MAGQVSGVVPAGLHGPSVPADKLQRTGLVDLVDRGSLAL